MGLLGYIRVSRPPLLFLGLIASLGLLSWAGHLREDPVRSWLIALTIFLGNWGWNLVNEVSDKAADSVNKPFKPVPSGQVSETDVLGLACSLILTSFLINVWLALNYDCIYTIGALAHLTSFVYNTRKKELVGNICMAATYGIAAFISLYPNHLLFALGFALLTLAFNCNTQFQDWQADKAAGVRTLPQQLGKMGTYWLTEILALFVLFVFLRIYLDTGYGPLLVFIATVGSVAISAYCMPTSEIKRERVDWMIENLTRRLGRFLLIIGFLWMILDGFL